MNDIQVLQSSQLFEGIEPEQIQILLGCLHAAVNTYQKGSLFCTGASPPAGWASCWRAPPISSRRISGATG